MPMKMRKTAFLIAIFVLFSGFSPAISHKYNHHKKYKKRTYTRIYTSKLLNVNQTDTTSYIWGIDVSHHQKTIDWDQVLAQKPHFVFIKATEGRRFIDHNYCQHKQKAETMGAIVGSYHFFSYISSGRDQALHFINNACLVKGNLPPVLDVEFKRRMPKAKKVTENIIQWLETVEAVYGVCPIIYCNYKFYNKYLKDKLKKEYPLWIPDYFNEPKISWVFWQKSDKFKLKGITKTVDFNIFAGTKESLVKILL
jgi:lysozyme